MDGYRKVDVDDSIIVSRDAVGIVDGDGDGDGDGIVDGDGGVGGDIISDDTADSIVPAAAATAARASICPNKSAVEQLSLQYRP